MIKIYFRQQLIARSQCNISLTLSGSPVYANLDLNNKYGIKKSINILYFKSCLLANICLYKSYIFRPFPSFSDLFFIIFMIFPQILSILLDYFHLFFHNFHDFSHFFFVLLSILLDNFHNF